MDYFTISDEVRRLSYALEGAGADTIAAEQTRLRGLAAGIEDEAGRGSALARVDALPRLIGGPHPGTSPQFHEASSLAGAAHGLTGPVADRIAEARRIRTRIAELAAAAPRDESMTIRRMNGTITKIIQDLEAADR